MKKLFSSKSFLTVMSILSILLGFALLCGGALACLHSLGVVSFSTEDTEVMAAPGDFERENHLVYTKIPGLAEKILAENEVPKALLMEMPFIDEYYVKLEVRSDGGEDAFPEGVYEIWCKGDRYRLHRYHLDDDEVEYVAICDGERVQMTDFTTTSIEYHPYSEAYALSAIAPFPNFRELFAEEYIITSYAETENILSISCKYPQLSLQDHAEFSKETGMLLLYSRLRGQDTILSVNVITIYDSYQFMDDMFSLS